MAYKSAPVNVSGNGDNQLIAGVAGCIFQVVNLLLIPAATVTMKFTDGAGGTVLAGPLAVTTQGIWPGFAMFFGPGPVYPFFSTQALGGDLTLNLSAGTQVGGWINYIQLKV
jgi:hypothetical protein